MADHVELPAELRSRAEARAAEAGVPLEEFVTQAIEEALRVFAAGTQG